MLVFNSTLVVTDLLCTKSLANVPHCGHTSRLKFNLDPADPSKNRNLENWSQYSGTKEIVALAKWCYSLQKILGFLLCCELILPWAMTVGIEKRTVLHSFGKVKYFQGYSKTCGWIGRIVGFEQ